MKRSVDKIKYFTYKNNIQGSRKTANKESNTVIDFSISNKDIIKAEKYLQEWQISDHYGIETIINWKPKKMTKQKNIKFDRKLLTENSELRNKLRIHNYEKDLTESDPQKIFDNFYLETYTVAFRHELFTVFNVKLRKFTTFYVNLRKFT